MNKKKAIKIATASAIAASGFVAAAPAQTEASTPANVKSQVDRAKNIMVNAMYSYGKPYVNEDILEDRTVVYEAYKKGEAQYKYAVNYVNKYAKGADKTKYLADLSNTRNKYLLGRALNYIKSFNALELKVEPAAAKAQDAIADAKKVEEVEAAQAEFKKVWDAQQKDLKAVIESDIEETILEFAQEAADAVEAAADAKIEELKKAEEEGKKVKEVSAVADKEINEGEALPALPATVEVTLNNGEKAQKAVVWNTSAVDTSKPATYEVTGVVSDTDLTAKVNVVVKYVAPAVSSVSAINATTVTVTFDKDVTAEEAKTIKVLNGTTEVAYTSAVEGKVATLTLDAPFYVGTTLTVEFGGVTTDVTGTVADPELTDVENATNAVVALEEAVKDLTAENIANAEAAVVTANEALKAVDTASVKEDLTSRIEASEVKIADAKKAAEDAAKLAEQVKAAQDAVAELEAAVVELKDVAAVTAAEAAVTKAEDAVKALPEGNENIAELTAKVDAAKATIATAKVELAKPVVSEVSAINGTVTVNFDKALTNADVNDFKVTQGDKEVTASKAELSEDKKSVVLTVEKVDVTKDDQTVSVTVSYKGAEAKSASFSVAGDKEAPKLSVGDVAETVKDAKLTVTGTVEDAKTVTVNGEEVTVTDGKFSKELTLAEGDNTITVVAVDAVGNETKIEKTVKLDTKPVVAEVSAINGTVTVKFDKEVAEAAVADFKVTQKIGSGEAKEVEVSKAELSEDKKSVVLSVAKVEVAKEEQSVVTSVSYKDAEAKAAEAFKVDGDAVAPKVDAANSKVADYQTLTVAFDEAVKGTPSVTVNGTAEAAANVVLAEDGKSLTVKRTAGFAAGTFTVVVSGLTDLAGNALATSGNSAVITKAASDFAKVEVKSSALAVTPAVGATPAGTEASVTFEAFDQYGQKYTTISGSPLTLVATYNGFPVGEVTNETGEFKFDLNNAGLKKDRAIDLKVYKTVDSKLVEIGASQLTVVEEVSVAKTIDTLTTAATDIKAGDTISLAATLKDQFGNPVTELPVGKALRWVTSDKEVLAFAGNESVTFEDGESNTTFTNSVKVKKQGAATITAYLPDGSAFKSYTVNVGKGNLAEVIASSANVSVTNKATLTASNVGVNAESGSYLQFENANDSKIGVAASGLSFEVTAPTGYNASDVAIEKVTDASGVLTGLKITSTRTALTDLEKAGDYRTGVNYTVTVKSDVQGVANQTFTVTSKIDAAVASVSDITFSTNEVTKDTAVKKAVQFFNKYGEVINVTRGAVNTSDSTGLSVGTLKKDAQGNLIATTEDSDVVAGLTFTASSIGDKTALVTSGVASKNYSLTAVEAAGIKSVEVAGTTSVIKTDAYDQTASSIADGIYHADGKAYKVLPVSFKNQYNNAAPVLAKNLTVTGTGLEVVELKANGTVAGAEEEVAYIAVHATAEAAASVNATVSVTSGTAEGYENKTIAVTTTAARAVKSITLADTNLTVVPNAKVKKEIVVKDQYDVAVTDVRTLTVESSASGKSTAELSYDSEAKKMYIEYTGVAEGTAVITVKSAAEQAVAASANITVSGNTAINSVKFDARNYKVYNAAGTENDQEVTLTYKVNEGSFTLPANQLTFVYNTDLITVTPSNTKNEITVVAKANTAAAGIGDADGKVSITVLTPNGKTDTIELTLSDDTKAVSADTATFAEAVDEKSAAGVQVVIGKDKDNNDVVEYASTLTLEGINQYGEKVDVTGDTTWVISDSSIATINGSGVVNAVKAGSTTVTGFYKGKLFNVEVSVAENAISSQLAAAQAILDAREAADAGKLVVDAEEAAVAGQLVVDAEEAAVAGQSVIEAEEAAVAGQLVIEAEEAAVAGQLVIDAEEAAVAGQLVLNNKAAYDQDPATGADATAEEIAEAQEAVAAKPSAQELTEAQEAVAAKPSAQELTEAQAAVAANPSNDEVAWAEALLN